MHNESENTGFAVPPKPLERKSMTFEKPILCCPWSQTQIQFYPESAV